MRWLGMFCLGGFMGFVICFGLTQITDWSNPGTIFSAVVSTAIAGGTFTFIQWLNGDTPGVAPFFYPVGLAYGALCANIRWVTGDDINWWIAGLHIGAFAFASVALLLLFVCPPFRKVLPEPDLAQVFRAPAATEEKKLAAGGESGRVEHAG
jgi:hypothetical protein